MFSGGNPRCPRRCTEWRPGCLLRQTGRSRRATIGELSVNRPKTIDTEGCLQLPERSPLRARERTHTARGLCVWNPGLAASASIGPVGGCKERLVLQVSPQDVQIVAVMKRA